MNIKMLSIRPEHLELVMKWRMRPYITQFMNTDPKLTIEGQEKWFARVNADDTQYHWVITMDNNPIGVINITNIDRDNLRCAWGYYVAVKEARSLKLAISLECSLYDYVFTELALNKCYGETLSDNIGVIKLHLLCGCTQDGVLRQHCYKNGAFFDVVCTSMLREDWLGMHQKRIPYEKYDFEK